ncbi:MAG: hypothetical protein MK220_00200, partial [Candidatus Poseidoniia archaeon]|nr:hypothetical protein [Candidatus Poseidoniia archaeon]
MTPPPVPGSGPSPLLATGVVLTLVVAALLVYQPPTPSGLTTAQSDFLQDLVQDQGRSSPQLAAYESCDALEGDLKEHLKDEMRATLASNLEGNYYRGGGGGWLEGDVMVALDGAEMDDGGGSPESPAS